MYQSWIQVKEYHTQNILFYNCFTRKLIVKLQLKLIWIKLFYKFSYRSLTSICSSRSNADDNGIKMDQVTLILRASVEITFYTWALYCTLISILWVLMWIPLPGFMALSKSFLITLIYIKAKVARQKMKLGLWYRENHKNDDGKGLIDIIRRQLYELEDLRWHGRVIVKLV